MDAMASVFNGFLSVEHEHRNDLRAKAKDVMFNNAKNC